MRVDPLASLLVRTKPIASTVADAFDIRPDSWLENSLLYPISSYITINTLDKLCQKRKSGDLNRKRQN